MGAREGLQGPLNMLENTQPRAPWGWLGPPPLQVASFSIFLGAGLRHLARCRNAPRAHCMRLLGPVLRFTCIYGGCQVPREATLYYLCQTHMKVVCI